MVDPWLNLWTSLSSHFKIVGQNSYTSSFPKWPQNMKNLTYLDLGKPSWYNDECLHYSRTQRTSNWADRRTMLSFRLWIAGGNFLVGDFPAELSDILLKLTHLDLSKWFLYDLILCIFIRYSLVSSFMISWCIDGNNLEGTLPTAIGKLTDLEHLNLGKLWNLLHRDLFQMIWFSHISTLRCIFDCS